MTPVQRNDFVTSWVTQRGTESNMSAIKTKVKYFHHLLFSPCFHSGEVDESGDKWGWAGYKAIHLTMVEAYPAQSQGGGTK